jgi:hypothetical protein
MPDGLPEGFPRPRIPSGTEEGWHPVIAEVHAQLLRIDPKYTVDQVKEKYGKLRYYFTASKPERRTAMEVVVDEAEQRSGTICERCGAPAPGPRGPGWLKTYCDTHYKTRRSPQL